MRKEEAAKKVASLEICSKCGNIIDTDDEDWFETLSGQYWHTKCFPYDNNLPGASDML